MGFPSETPPFLAPAAAVLACDPAALERAEARLSAFFGPPLRTGAVFPFSFTGYYVAETGPGAVKRFLVYAPTAAPDLAAWKRWSGEVEADLAREIRAFPRPANVDPGTLGLGNLVLASTKDAFHRVYVGRGIFAEVELAWNAGAFHPLPWTYADYRTPGALAFFTEAREALKGLRRDSLRGTGGRRESAQRRNREGGRPGGEGGE
ncbi:MAG: DUF4416 family protein [Planctomycetes bacterium]|jgi:hypothetical protein|nr:DUF4416 family protein [Planctomycetota bacterium]